MDESQDSTPMRNPPWHKQPFKAFISSVSHHAPRMEKSTKLLFVAAIMLPLGLYLILNGLPDTSSSRARIIVNGTPTMVGGLALIYGCVGVLTAWSGMARKGSDAIDLKIASSGITVRGGHKIPWKSISRVTSIQYDNTAKIQLLWDRADLNRAFEVHFNGPMDIPRLRTKDGVPYLKVNVVRYPAVDYTLLHEAFIAEFERRGIPIDEKRKTKET
ncbi:hypothetical protein CVS28_17985 [Arthrobacter glacialis]|nr:hypothetical protein CVS28_17985 [Arthrobacter glacialis]